MLSWKSYFVFNPFYSDKKVYRWNPGELAYLLAMIVVLTSSTGKWSQSGEARMRRRWVFPILGVVLLIASLHGNGQALKSVHIAIERIERAEPAWLQRAWAYPDHALEGYRFFWASLGAAAAVAASALALVFLFRVQSNRARALLGVGLLCSQAIVLAFNTWYSNFELPRVSPELAGSGSEATRHDWTLGTGTAAIAGILAAYWMTRRREEASDVPSPVCFHESPLMLVIMKASVVAFPVVTVALNWDPSLTVPFWKNVSWTVQYLIQDPSWLLQCVTVWRACG